MKPVKLRRIGGSFGVTLPKSLLDELDLKEGDELHVMRTRTGIELTQFDPTFGEALEIAEEAMRRHPNAMRSLADR
jgi:putative addiction module antidote